MHHKIFTPDKQKQTNQKKQLSGEVANWVDCILMTRKVSSMTATGRDLQLVSHWSMNVSSVK